MPAPRTPQQRLKDTLHRLENDIDVWVATADPETGAPYLVPLSFLWDGETLLISTPTSSRTARNLSATGEVRLGLGPTRDVVMIDATATPLPAADLPTGTGDAFAAKTGFDPRRLKTPYLYFRIEPRRVQAWREENELEGRGLMSDGDWIVP
ncbi:pyridoxamine 5'-phosphate oxidase family protein [Planomonospora sp. ID67723]|uniref:pyridoxamine 5'-phosphate oxidase family protein n=1 Tax=Planomonospora sp. ID67723 TaxID=2738134 RepID=UPI0018C3C1DD|nr:pyridoxamine 5'-phosphate oxidase family protein [Planomonospora sp. ID67723]MBG0827388.1 pyridoxamine 5'-phosphate oxidase family protein [Planomonospora sp. ID67723]